PGSHWVAIFIDKNGTADYFDSYGLPPTTVTPISRYFQGFRKQNWSSQNIQAPFSSVCGHYCIYFILHRWKNIPFDHILKTFSPDCEENDEAITDWINETFDLDTETYDVEFLINQICQSR
ncbi:MAG: hypothetical protein DRR11_20385, partial [Gammaproteobacteria bacterium]